MKDLMIRADYENKIDICKLNECIVTEITTNNERCSLTLFTRHITDGFLKNHTHVKKVGHTSEFLFIDELEKRIIIKKTVEVGQ